MLDEGSTVPILVFTVFHDEESTLPLSERARTNRKWTVSVDGLISHYEKATIIPGQAGGTPRACAIHRSLVLGLKARCRVSSRAFEILAPCHSKNNQSSHFRMS